MTGAGGRARQNRRQTRCALQGHQKGTGTHKENVARNFGMPHRAGYRKAHAIDGP